MDYHPEEAAIDSGALEKIVDRMLGSSLRSSDPSKQLLATVELISRSKPSVRPQARPNETVLGAGLLELDLIDRTAKRGDRPIDLRPRQFQLLKYMIRRSDQLRTRATLFDDAWHYKIVHETNLVDVHVADCVAFGGGT